MANSLSLILEMFCRGGFVIVAAARLLIIAFAMSLC